MVDADSLARLALFADLSTPQIESVAHMFDEQRFGRDERVLRQGLTGTGFYVILGGEASVRIDGHERARLTGGEFFGEISILASEPPTADVVAATDELRCAALPGPELAHLLFEHPAVMFRMLQTEARRLRSANLWQG
jgi:CRP-like cAMP-binding protein